MHSSRMRTGRSLTVCWCLLPGGVVCLVWGCLPGLEGVSVWSQGVCLVQGGVCWLVWGGVCLVPGVGGWGWWCLPGLGGLPGPGGLVRGGSPCRGALPARRPPSANRITHTCKNITLATTSLRPVKIISTCRNKTDRKH